MCMCARFCERMQHTLYPTSPLTLPFSNAKHKRTSICIYHYNISLHIRIIVRISTMQVGCLLLLFLLTGRSISKFAHSSTYMSVCILENSLHYWVIATFRLQLEPCLFSLALASRSLSRALFVVKCKWSELVSKRATSERKLATLLLWR